MSSNMIVDFNDFNAKSHIKYTTPKMNASGGKSVGIVNAVSNKALQMTTPLMLTWGISDYEGNEKYEMALQFPKDMSDSKDITFLEKMKEFEDKIKADAIINSKEWLGKGKTSPEVIDALFTPMLKYPKDKETKEPNTAMSPSLRVKVPYYDKTWKVEIYDVDENKLFPDVANLNVTPEDLVQKGCNAAVLMQCGGLWFANGKFGVTWRLIQCLVKPKESVLGRCQIKLDSSDKEKLKNTNTNDDEEDDNALVVAEDTDDENEETNEEVENDATEATEEERPPTPPPEEPVKKTVKRVVKKKASA